MLAPGSAEEDELLNTIHCLDRNPEILSLMMEKVGRRVEALHSEYGNISMSTALQDSQEFGVTLFQAWCDVRDNVDPGLEESDDEEDDDEESDDEEEDDEEEDDDEECDDEEEREEYYMKDDYSPNWQVSEGFTYDRNRGFGYIHTLTDDSEGNEEYIVAFFHISER